MPPGPITRPLPRDTLLHSQRPAARRPANRVERPPLPQTKVPVMAAIRPVGEPGGKAGACSGQHRSVLNANRPHRFLPPRPAGPTRNGDGSAPGPPRARVQVPGPRDCGRTPSSAQACDVRCRVPPDPATDVVSSTACLSATVLGHAHVLAAAVGA